jgi:tRNA1(Val) A37 N6-methylase TrmN6
VIYKFVELSVVTDETLEEVVNLWVGKGWQLDGIRFVISEASRRPQMAFVSFTRDAEQREPPTPREPPRLVR